MHLNPTLLALIVFLLGAAISFLVAGLIKGTFWAIKAIQRPTSTATPEKAAPCAAPAPELQA